MRCPAWCLLLFVCACTASHTPTDSAVGGEGGAPTASAGGAGGDEAIDDPDPELTEEVWKKLRELAPATLPAAPPDVTNRWSDDAAAAAFGQTLFFDARFSGALLDGDNDGTEFALGSKGDTGKVACAGCHLPSGGFSDTRTLGGEISLGAGWGLRRAPALLDVAQSKLLMWDGSRDTLFNQVFGVLESPVEMNSSRLYAAHQMFDHHKAEYEAIFGPLPALDDEARFPRLTAEQTGCRQLDKDNHCTGKQRGAPGDEAEFDALEPDDQDAVTRVWVNAGKAIAAYQRLLSCGASPFDAWVNGEADAISRAAQRGAALFVGKADCVSCHSGPYLSDEKFHNVGLRPQVVAVVFLDANDPGAKAGLEAAKANPLSSAGVFSDGDDGRLPTEIGPEMLGAFRTPRLRCVDQRPAFMHTGHVSNLEDVVEFFDEGGEQGGYLGRSELSPLNLNARERADLVAFMKSLTGPGPAEALLAPP